MGLSQAHQFYVLSNGILEIDKTLEIMPPIVQMEKLKPRIQRG
jgi:hypothetical protein